MVHILGKLGRRCGLITAAAAFCFTLAASSPLAQAQLADEPRYTPSGEFVLPSGFETWVFVGSNLGLSYTPHAAAPAAALPDPACANCQQQHAGMDKVWVQFYPAWRDRRQ